MYGKESSAARCTQWRIGGMQRCIIIAVSVPTSPHAEGIYCLNFKFTPIEAFVRLRWRAYRCIL